LKKKKEKKKELDWAQVQLTQPNSFGLLNNKAQDPVGPNIR
jgi:hypothetical protein